jgi:ComF family protein
MGIIEKAVRIFAPYTCIGCGIEDDRMLCQSCSNDLVPVASRCYVCGCRTDQYRTCIDCVPTTPLASVVSYAHYEGYAKRLVYLMKYERAKGVACELASLMSRHADRLPRGVLYVPVPTASSRVRMRGYDHAILLARHLAKQNGGTCALPLRRQGQTRQVGATKLERRRQLAEAYRLVRADVVQDRHIVLVDDVLTTGATLEAAARVIAAAAPRRIDAITFAQA